MRKGSGVVFAFLNYQESTQSLQKEMIRSFIFQILYEVPTLRPIIQKAYSTNYRQLHSSMEFSLGLFCDIIKSLDRVHVVIDGLDEIVETERRSLLKNLLELMDKCPNLRVLISSRKEADIERALRTRAQILSIEQKNSRDIRIYADKELRCWLAEEDIASSDSTEVEDFVQVVTEKSHGMCCLAVGSFDLADFARPGMFLYARLVMDHLRSQPNLEELKKELHNLPHGLEEAYVPSQQLSCSNLSRLLTLDDQLREDYRAN